MQAFKKYTLLILFSAFLIIVSAVDMLPGDHEFSEMENRYLAQRPKLSLSQLLENQYTLKYETYVNDQFVARDAWITLKSVSESAAGKIENNGIVYGKQNHLFEDFRTVDERRLEQNLGFLQSYLKQYRGKSDFSVGIVPSSYAVLQNLLPQGLQNVDQDKRIGEINARIEQDASVCDLFEAMHNALQEADVEDPGDPVYYLTDHHWTTFGAYCAYRDFVKSKGLKAADWETLHPLAHQVPGFYGSYYSKCKLFSAVPDMITYFDIPFQSITINGEEKTSLYDDSLWSKRDKHAAFLWGNNGLTVIRSSNNLNHQDGKTSRILLIKDSYGNSFAPFLTYSFDEIYVVDLRAMTGKMSTLMNEQSFDEVLLLYSFMNFSSDTNIWLLSE